MTIWKTLQVDECMDAILDYRGKTPQKVSAGVPLITAKIIKNGRIEEPAEFIAEEDYAAWMTRGLPLPGDVVLTTEAPLGEVAQLDARKIALAQRVITLRGRKGVLDNTFLKYALQTEFVRAQLLGRASGSTVSGIKQSELRKVNLPIPPFGVQRAIAQILSSLDEKIELNRQINQSLEHIAQAMFKSWFVDFEPVKAKIAANAAGVNEDGITRAAMRVISGKTGVELGTLQEEQVGRYHKLKEIAELFPIVMQIQANEQIPKGWHLRPLSTLIKLIGGGTPQRAKSEYWNGDIPWFSIKDIPADSDVVIVATDEKITEAGLKSSSTKLLPVGATIITARGTVGKLGLVATPMAMNQSCYGVLPVAGIGELFNYYNLKQAIATLQQNTHGAVFDTITSKTFETYSMPFCGITLANAFHQTIEPLIKRIEMNVRESHALRETRDTLLPKLLSGEINIDHIEINNGQ